MSPTRSNLNVAFVEIEQIQQAVWYWRRRNAGQLAADAADLVAPELFDGPTVARADAAFFALHDRPPQEREWLTTYWLVLQNVQRDPDFYNSTLNRLPPPPPQACLSILPGTATPRRVMFTNQNRGTVIVSMVCLIALLVGGAESMAMLNEPISTSTAAFIAVVILGVGIGTTLLGRSTTVVYQCPECGNEVGGPDATRCGRCYLEFAQTPVALNPHLMFQPSA